jgi:hypothetical protein
MQHSLQHLRSNVLSVLLTVNDPSRKTADEASGRVGEGVEANGVFKVIEPVTDGEERSNGVSGRRACMWIEIGLGGDDPETVVPAAVVDQNLARAKVL